MVGRILGGLEGGKEYDQNMLYKMINKKVTKKEFTITRANSPLPGTILLRRT